MDGMRTMDRGWTDAMKASLTKNRTTLIDTFAGSMPRIMDLLVEGSVFPDTDDIMNNTSLDTPKKRARKLLDDIPRKPARDYWTLVLSLYDEQASLGHMAEKILSTYEAKGGQINNRDVRIARRDYRESQRNGRPQHSLSLLSASLQPQSPPQQPPPQPLSLSPEQPEGLVSLPLRTPVQEVQVQPVVQLQSEFQIPVGGAGTLQPPGSTPIQEQRSTQPAAAPGWLTETNNLLTVDSGSQGAPYRGSHELMETDADQQHTTAHWPGDTIPKVPTPASNLQDSGDGTAETKYQRQRRKYPNKVYKMESNPRGVALIIDNEKFPHIGDREGTRNDCRLLEDLLQNVLHFQVLPVERDLTGQQMKAKLFQFSQNKQLQSTVDSCIVIILSHGYVDDIIFGTDGKLDANNAPVEGTYIRSSDLRNWFSSSACPLLAGKPKLFIFQACRGVKEDTNFGHLPAAPSSRGRIDLPGLETEQQRSQADFSDIYFLYSTVADFVAYRETFIPHLVDVFKEEAHTTQFKDMVSEVHRRVTGRPLFEESGPAGENIKKFVTSEERGNLPNRWYFNPPTQLANQ